MAQNVLLTPTPYLKHEQGAYKILNPAPSPYIIISML